MGEISAPDVGTGEDAKGASLRALARRRFKKLGPLIASIAAVGAIASGFVGYWNVWKTVRTDVLHVAPATTSAPQLVVSKGPTVAVLPLTVAAGGALDAFADTMTQQLTSSLGRFSTLRVAPRATAVEFSKQPSAVEAARKAGVDYLVTGDIRPLGDGARASVQVADLRSGAEIWSKSFDADADGVRNSTAGYELGDVAAAQIGGPPGAILALEYKKIQAKPVADLNSYECIVQGLFAGVIQVAGAIVRARKCLDVLVQKEPGNALAWSARASVLFAQRWTGFGLPADLAMHLEKRLYLNKEGWQDSARAVELAPDDALARFRYAFAVGTTCQTDLFRQEIGKAVALNPNDPYMLGILGINLAFQGDWDDGVAMAEKAIRLAGPSASFIWWYGPAKRHWFRGEYKEAYEDFRHAYVEGFWLTYLDHAYVLPFLGRLDEAKVAVAKLLKLQPDFTIREADAAYRMFCFQPAYIEKMNGALRQAGLPE